MKPVLWISVLLVAACTSAGAQHMGAPHFSARTQGFHPGYFGHGRGGNIPALYPYPLLDSLYSDYLPTEPAPQPLVVVQSPPPARAAEPAPEPSQPLLIELRGDNYVQLTGNPNADSKSQTITPGATAKISKPQTLPTRLTQEKPALLVFRDGHEEEVRNYTISNGVLYASADYYSVGSWNRAIQISSLNIPQTIASNQARGVPFHVPGSPNEVVVGP
jgi:hypothetical protein